jgi:hypothetical protein
MRDLLWESSLFALPKPFSPGIKGSLLHEIGARQADLRWGGTAIEPRVRGRRKGWGLSIGIHAAQAALRRLTGSLYRPSKIPPLARSKARVALLPFLCFLASLMSGG